jgi:hypothetical protein
MAGDQPGGDQPAVRRRFWRRSSAPRPARQTRRGWIFRIVTGGLVVVVLIMLASYLTSILRPSSMSLGERSAEWLRTVPGGNWIVDESEHYYYTWNAPHKGGPELSTLPKVGLPGGSTAPEGSKAGTHRSQSAPWPPPIAPVFPHPLAGEGVWKPTGPPVDGGPPVLVTTFRTERAYPRIVAYVAWFDHTRTDLAFYPGRYEPPKAAVRGPAMVPQDQRSRLLATFNAGFIYSDGLNGSTDNGRVNEPLTPGNATLVGYRDGRVAITKWSGGPNAPADVAWTRQSLSPIVWGGRLNPALNTNPDSSRWGYTLGNAVRVWRTGVGVDRRGNLMFVAADDQTVISLAKILQHAGAVRAMEFDINPEWHTLITYSHQKGLTPSMVEPQPMQPANRYLVPDDRDFFAVYRRAPGPVTVPFK